MTFYSKSLFSKGGDFFFGNADIGIKTFTNLLIYSIYCGVETKKISVFKNSFCKGHKIVALQILQLF